MADKTIEDAFDSIEKIIEKMQNKDTSLAESFALYEEGMKEVSFCNKEIDGVEKKIRILTKEQESDGDAEGV
ncbi:MAG: exodeoxyribonuclease VII small subunit [Lachnospiraceae bacterium]|nr:exodeoxyribonuclease VII small subunit [Lachnospiraceae bacterium]